jgi:FtsH-binding integral membrane protein
MKIKSKNILIILFIASIITVAFNQSSLKPNLYITCGGIVVFMYAMMRLSSKISSKNPDDYEQKF